MPSMSRTVPWGGRELPVTIECDVLVCGGGPAGLAAATAAARCGARTVLLERYGFLGGMASAGMVNPVYGFYARDRQVVTGIGQELVELLAAIPGGTGGHQSRHDCAARRAARGECVAGRDDADCPVATVANVCPIDAEAVKLAALRLLDSAGVATHLHTHVVEALRDGERIAGVVTWGKGGFAAACAGCVVDATGDADVAASAGVAFRSGSEEDGATKPPSLMFRIGGVRLSKDRIRARWPENEALAAGGTGCWLMALPRAGEYTVNSPTGIAGFDATRTADLSAAQAEATRQAFRKVELLRLHVPGCEEARLISVAPQLGLRDSRRIVGDYVLTAEDVLECRHFDDGIANGVHPIDLHTGSPRFGGRTIVPMRCGGWYQIPYRCLLPRGAEHLLVAGRSVSADFLAQGSVRVMATCLAMGQAAGTAAALCSATSAAPRALDPALLRRRLREQGVTL